MRARFYDAKFGRFLSEDPIGAQGADNNYYRYVGNTPIMAVDPAGLKYVNLNVTIAFGPGVTAGSMTDLSTGCEYDYVGFGGGTPGIAATFSVFDPTPGPNLVINFGMFGGAGSIGFNRRREASAEVGFGTPGIFAGFTWVLEPVCPPGQDPGSDQHLKDGQTNGKGNGKTPTAIGNTVGQHTGSTFAAKDPNEKAGPGFAGAGYVRDNAILPYRIDFENDAEATAPAQRVTVSDQLSSELDWDTFELAQFGFGDVQINIPAGLQHFQTTVDMNYNYQDFEVEVELGLHSDTGEVYAVFQSIDPGTSLPPDLLTGFLPPEDGTGRGLGFFSYTVHPQPDLPTETEIRNIATIVFDEGEVIDTNQIDPHDPYKGTDPSKEALVTIDAAGPTSRVGELPETSPASFEVTWTGEDDAGGSGVGSYDIFVAENDGAFELWLDDTTETSAVYAGLGGTTYRFYSLATDNVGHTEQAPSVADAVTTVTAGPTSPTGDYNGNGIVAQGDLDLVLLNWGENSATPPAGWIFDAPVGAVDQQELDIVLLNWGESVLHPVPVGDYNGNGLVEQADVDLVLLNWGRDSATSRLDGWVNAFPNGVVDQEELDELLLNWGATLETLGDGAKASRTSALFGSATSPRVLSKPVANIPAAYPTSQLDSKRHRISRVDAFFDGIGRGEETFSAEDRNDYDLMASDLGSPLLILAQSRLPAAGI